MADDLIEDDYRRAPEPYSHLIASPVFSPIWGRGWLGYTRVRDAIDLWYVQEDLGASLLLDYVELMTFDDKVKSQLWVIMGSVKTWRTVRGMATETASTYYSSVVFLLNPPEEMVLFPIPPRLNRFLESYHGRREPDC